MSYLGIDIGGTKTFVAIISSHGIITQQIRFETPVLYQQFLDELHKALGQLKLDDVTAVGVGVPGLLNREKGLAIAFGNLAWKNVPIQKDIHALIHRPVAIENDARLAGLSEAVLLKDHFRKVLYLTVSTGIGIGVTVDGMIDPALEDAEIRGMPIEYRGHLVNWESFASGKAIIDHFNKAARDIHDAKTWKIIAHNLALGLVDLIAIIQPDVIVFGGGVGQYLNRFEKPLKTELERFSNPMLTIPPLRVAARPNEAVIYGCYNLVKALHGRTSQ